MCSRLSVRLDRLSCKKSASTQSPKFFCIINDGGRYLSRRGGDGQGVERMGAATFGMARLGKENQIASDHSSTQEPVKSQRQRRHDTLTQPSARTQPNEARYWILPPHLCIAKSRR